MTRKYNLEAFSKDSLHDTFEARQPRRQGGLQQQKNSNETSAVHKAAHIQAHRKLCLLSPYARGVLLRNAAHLSNQSLRIAAEFLRDDRRELVRLDTASSTA